MMQLTKDTIELITGGMDLDNRGDITAFKDNGLYHIINQGQIIKGGNGLLSYQ